MGEGRLRPPNIAQDAGSEGVIFFFLPLGKRRGEGWMEGIEMIRGEF